MKQRHKLLERQLKRFFDQADALPEEMQAFIEAVNNAYSQSDKDRFMLERALELSSRELMQANSEMRATLESTADGILVVDAQGKIVSFNQKFVEMWGIPDDILASRDTDKAIAFVLDKFSNPDSFLKKVREIYAQPDIETYDILKLKNGTVIERYSLPQKLGNTCVGRVWSFHDITKNHLIEQEQE